jgi:hypothetical protein
VAVGVVTVVANMTVSFRVGDAVMGVELTAVR